MGEAEVIGSLAQFGMAGLIAVMWLVERRAAQQREREVTEAHGRLMSQRTELDSLLQVVRDNTRAVSALEGGQRELTALLHRSLGQPQAASGTAGAGVGAVGGR